ncbi:MAG: TetR/AcrR family transcriptional regulator [Pseudomonadota bacterium]
MPATPTAPAAKRVRAPKLSSADREQMIASKAVEYFARHGFGASTRDLAKDIGVTQSLLYRYFPTKQALTERVYQEVYLSRWNPLWEELVSDRSLSLHERLNRYYLDYAGIVLRNDWVRILIFAGLEHEGINDQFFRLLKERILVPVVRECVAEFHPAALADFSADRYNIELELVWALHASIFYIGMRKWVYTTTLPDDVDATIGALVSSFLEGMRSRIRSSQAFIGLGVTAAQAAGVAPAPRKAARKPGG